MNLQKTLLWSAMFSASLGLAGCGGGGGSAAVGTSETAGVSGVVADGYLEGAEVCLDLNGNKVCDPDEPSTITGAGGAYTLEATAEQAAAASIIANIIAGVTVDTDIGGVVDEAYTLSAPAGKPEFVSPITTLIQSKIESNPSMTPDQAESSVKDDLGITDKESVDLYANFIEEGESDDNYLIIHQTAQVVARVLADFTDTLKTTLETAGVEIGADDLDEIQHIVAEAITAQLPTIYASASQQITDNGEVDVSLADQVSDSVDDSTVKNMDEESYLETKEEYGLLTSAENISIADALQQGGAVFMTMDMDSEYDESAGSVTQEAEVDVMAMLPVNGEPSFYEASVDLEGVYEVENEQAIKDRMIAMNPVDDIEQSDVTLNNDGSVSFTTYDGNELQVHTVSKISLAGKTFKLQDVIRDYRGDESRTVTFGENDASYHFAYSETPSLHLGNIGQLQSFSELCPTIESDMNQEDYACEPVESQYMFSYYNPSTDSHEQHTVSELAANDAALESVINSWYWGEEQLNFYIKDSSTKTVAMCKYDSMNAAGMPECIDNTEVLLGSYKSGVLADGVTPYVAIPTADYDNEKLDIEYSVFTTDGSADYRVDHGMEADGSTETGVFKPFNFSAMKKIIEAL